MSAALAPFPDMSGERIVKYTSISLSEEEWFHTYQTLAGVEPYHMLLESGRAGQFSIMGLKPFAILQGKDQTLKVTTAGGEEVLKGDLLTLMREWMSPFMTARIEELPDFHGGALGFVSYDLIRQIEELPEKASDDLETDDLYFLVFDEVFVYDHAAQKLWIIVHGTREEEKKAEERRDEWTSVWQQPFTSWCWEAMVEKEEKWEPSFDQDSFAEAVQQIQHYIRQGDVFQVNVSVRQTKPLRTPPFHIYEKLRELNPSPYMSYMHTPDFQLVSGSPELLIKKRGNEASTRPIAGTRPRGKDDEEDQCLVDELLENEKEKAEHVMLVDLERNDLGRVCTYGSVHVDELMVVEKYSHVMHIVSNVKGFLGSEVDAYDMIRATFPGGTITGAPKIRTMEIIEELEPVRRGIYTGSIGWIGFNGDMELNITIRTMLAKEGQAFVQAGAGIVIDSDPVAEYHESLRKAEALWKAKQLSEEEFRKARLVE
ncbi:anthranilate synthase component I family protein [Salsuginibacillus kocurii]|uniref:anthranilate synthase component I family protein n=1 Tax=Salsuginibacillus kocurii TaxID=427078 RepID=UPI000380CF78|nr:anthranilate synthase component I family protein [Salsuginibacillus kocurii]